MKAYHDLLTDVLENGESRGDRTGTGTLSVFGRQARFDLREGFPCLTTKKLHLRSIIHELLWFLKGETNIAYLKENKVTIWDEWADENGELGPVYGKQWRAWETDGGRVIDQIALLIDGLKGNPQSRRHIVSAWNVGDVSRMALPPCHLLFQFYVHEPTRKRKARPLLPALPTQCGSLSWSTIQHRLLRPAHPPCSPGLRLRSPRFRSHLRRPPPLREPPRPSETPAHSRSQTASKAGSQSRGKNCGRLPLRGHFPRGLRSSPDHQSSHRCIKAKGTRTVVRSNAQAHAPSNSRSRHGSQPPHRA